MKLSKNLGDVQSSASLNDKIKSKTFHEIDGPTNVTVTLKQTFNFIDCFGKLLGWNFSYDWTWKNNPRHLITIALLVFSWILFLYSQFKYFANGEYKRIFEVFALYGAGISVILVNLSNKKVSENLIISVHTKGQMLRKIR